MTDKPSREDVLRVAGEPVAWWTGSRYVNNTFAKSLSEAPLPGWIALYTEAQLLAMYAAGAEDMRERAAGVCHQLSTGGFSTEDEMECVVRTLGVANTAIRALPIATEQAPCDLPEGWQLVPIEPTYQMLDVLLRLDGKHERVIYQELLAAAPKRAITPTNTEGEQG